MTATTLKTAPMTWTEKADPQFGDKGPRCTCCGKVLLPGKARFYIHSIEGGRVVLHPDSEADYAALGGKVTDSSDMGWWPVGPECARKFGKGFATPSEVLDEMFAARA